MVSIKQKLSSSPNNQRITEITNYNDFRTSEMISVLSISNWLTGIWLSCPLIIPIFHNVLSFAPTGLHANTTDIMAEVEGFGKSSQLLITSKMIEIFLPFLNGSRRADRQAVQTGTAVLY